MPHWFRRAAALAVLLVLTLGTRSALAQAPPARLDGRIATNGQPVTDASVSLIGDGRQISVRTNAQGVFHATLEPGQHTLRVERPGASAVTIPAFRASPGAQYRLAIDIGSVDTEHSLTRIDAAEADALSEPWLSRMPLDRRHPFAATAELLTNIADGAALGGGAGTGSVRRIDGVDLTDPIDGAALAGYTVAGAGMFAVTTSGVAAAERPFSGAVIDVVTRAGGNAFSGLFDARATGEGLRSDNTTEDLLSANPLLADRDVLRSDADVSGWLGGPLRRDRAFISGVFGYTHSDDDPTGPRTTRRTTAPRTQARLTLAAGASNMVGAALLFDDRETTGAAPADVARVTTDDIANRDEARTVATRFVWQHVLTPQTRLRADWSFVDSSRRTEPESLAPGRLDAVTNTYTGSLGLTDSRDGQRHVAGAVLATTLRWAGAHAIEAGGEIDAGRVHTTSGFVDDRFFVDFGGRPNLEIEWAGAAQEGRSRRLSAHARDVWAAGNRLTIDAGVRIDAVRGSTPDLGTVYSASIVQPRVGAVFAIDRGGRTVARASYGQYAEPLWFSHYDRATPGVTPIASYEILADGTVRLVERVVTPVYDVASNLRHPRFDEAAAGVTHRLNRSLTVEASFVQRDTRDVVDAVFPDARWIPVVRPGLPGQTVTVYRWANRAASEQRAVIGNVDGVRYLTTTGALIDAATVKRDYRAVTVSARYEPASDSFSVWGSWTFAQVEGTVDDTFAANISRSARFQSPSASLVNVEGDATHTPSQKATVLASSRLPWIAARVTAVYVARTGRRYAAVRQFGNETLDFPQSADGRQVFLEPRGARTLAAQHALDLRGEYALRFGGHQTVTLYVDAMNLLNRSEVVNVSTFYPFASAGGAGILAFEAPIEVRAPRQIYFGGRWSF